MVLNLKLYEINFPHIYVFYLFFLFELLRHYGVFNKDDTEVLLSVAKQTCDTADLDSSSHDQTACRGFELTLAPPNSKYAR